MDILLAGGAGYIGLHVYASLISSKFRPVILDNFECSQQANLSKLKVLTGINPEVINCDLRDLKVLRSKLKSFEFGAVIFLAGYKSVPDSFEYAVDYHFNNSVSLLNLLWALKDTSCRRIIFSSSASVYGFQETLPIAENAELKPSSPYARTKFYSEKILGDASHGIDPWSVGIFRYFNPIGAHDSHLLGESADSSKTNILPQIIKVAAGFEQSFGIYGSDYATIDGTCIRDYIHVMDLADGHVAGLRNLIENKSGFTLNLGTGQGTSVRQLLEAFESANRTTIPTLELPRRDDDIVASYTDPSLAHELLGWRAARSIPEACRASWQYFCLSNS